MQKNNLEKIFREKLDGFTEIPSESVWNSISATLDKKKKKRIAPIWWKLGGVAASLAILLYFINPFEENTTVNQQTTDVDNTIKSSNPTNNKQQIFSSDSLNQNSPNNIKLANIEPTSPTENTSSKKNTKSSKNKALYTNNSTTNSSTSPNIPPTAISKNSTDKLLIADNRNSNNTEESIDKNNLLTYKQSLETLEDDKKPASSKTTKNKGKVISKENKKESQSKTEVTISSSTKKDEKKSLFDVIEKQKEEELAIAEKKTNRWSIGPSVAPVYFDAVGQGSPIHPDFIQNSKSGNVNLSYGLAVAYNLGKRLKIRSGIHRIDYGYETNEVQFSSSLTQSSVGIINNIDFSESSRTIVLQSQRTNSNTTSDNITNSFARESLFLDGSILQQIGYLEVPLELNYALIDKKIAVTIIGGISSLFLVNNSVALESEGLVTDVGEANNINSINFSTNFGVGFNYNFSSKVQLNLEPVFKYQLNTFSNTSGDFNPYALGVYSGFLFNF